AEPRRVGRCGLQRGRVGDDPRAGRRLARGPREERSRHRRQQRPHLAGRRDGRTARRHRRRLPRARTRRAGVPDRRLVPERGRPVRLAARRHLRRHRRGGGRAGVRRLPRERGGAADRGRAVVPARALRRRHPRGRPVDGRDRDPLARPRDGAGRAGRRGRDLPRSLPLIRMATADALTAGPATRRARGLPGADGVGAVTIALWIACGFFVLLPIAALAVLAGDGRQLGVLLQGDVVEAAVNSAVSAVSSALLAVALGTAFALLLDRTDVPGRRGLRLLALSPLLMPPLVGATAWLGIAGPTIPVNLAWREAFGAPLWSIYGADGVILLLSIHSYPIVMLVVSAALKRIPSDLEQAARVSGAGPVRAVLGVTLPLLRPALLSSFVLVAVGNLADFGLPSIIGLPERYVTLATLVYRYLQSGTVDEPLAIVATIGIVVLVVALVGLLIDALVGRRGWELDASAAAPQPIPLHGARWPVGAAMWL